MSGSPMGTLLPAKRTYKKFLSQLRPEEWDPKKTKFLQGTTEIEIWHRLLGGNQESCSLQSGSKSMVTFYDTPPYCIWILVKEKEMYKLFFYLHIEGYIEAVSFFFFHFS